MATVRVVLADDHRGIRAAFRHLLESEPDINVVGEAADGVEALDAAQQLMPDVLVLDMEMPSVDGVEVARRLKLAQSPVRVLVLSVHDDEHYIRSVVASGAAGYLTKEEAPRMIADAVRGVSRGEKGWFSQRVLEKIPDLQQ